MNRKNQLILHVTSALFVLVLTYYGAPAYAQEFNHLTITNPPPNGIVSSGFVVSGNYKSSIETPQILIELNNVNYTAIVGNGQFNFTTSSITDGTYNMVVFLFDTSATYRASVQFNQISTNVAPTKYDLIVPYYGESCSRMIANGDYSECPPFKDLISADTSNQAISGHIVMKKDGTYIRDKPEVPNHYLFYVNMTEKKVCVGCDVDLTLSDSLQQVIIEPTGFSFTNHEFTTVVTNNTLPINPLTGNASFYITNTNEISAGIVVHHDWYADPSCSSVTIDYSKERYDDAIAYLKSGCTSHAYNSTTTSVIPNHPFSLTSPFSSLALDAYKESIFHGHKQFSSYNQTNAGGLGPGNCINQKCAFSDPYKKKGY